MVNHLVRISQHLGSLLVERDILAREDQTRDAGVAARLYVES